MFNQVLKAVMLMSFASGFLVSGANAMGNGPYMKTAGLTSQPIGHYEYCERYSSDCNIKSWNAKATKLTKQRWSDLVEINNFSNNTIRPVTDMEIFNREEVWIYPETQGDCEDYVLMKRHMLMQRGWPASSLLITVVRQSNGEGHAVLTVRTDKADYILDNLDGKIRAWNETDYTYLKRQSERHSGRWIDIKDYKV